MKPLTGSAFAKLLERQGWRLLRVNGSHYVYGKPGEASRLVLPILGNRDLKIGLQRSLMRLAGLAEDDMD